MVLPRRLILAFGSVSLVALPKCASDESHQSSEIGGQSALATGGDGTSNPGATGGQTNAGGASNTGGASNAGGTSNTGDPGAVPTSVQIHPLSVALSGTRYEYGRVSDVCIADTVTHDLLCPVMNASQSAYLLYSSRDRGASWSLVSGSSTAQGVQLYASSQDSQGTWHLLHYYGGEPSYAKVTLTRKDGHVSGWSWGSTIALPKVPGTLGRTSATAITTVLDGAGTEKIIITAVDGNDGDRYRAVICQASLSPSATSGFRSLSGTASSWTVLPTQTQSSADGVQWAPYVFNASTQPYGSSGNLFVAVGPSGQNDKGDYGCPALGTRLLASGTSWKVDSTTETLSADSYESLLGASCRYNQEAYFTSSNRTRDSGTGNLYVSRVTADGTFTASVANTLTYGAYTSEPALFCNVTAGGALMLAELPIDGATTFTNTRARLHTYLDGKWSSADFRSTSYDGELVWAAAGSSGVDEGLIIVTSDPKANYAAQIGTAFWVR